MDLKSLETRLEKAGLGLPLTFNFNDKKRLAATKNETELKEAWGEIADSISAVGRANRAINHSNFS